VRRLLLTLAGLGIAALAGAQTDDEAFRDPEPRLEVSGGPVFGGLVDGTSVLGLEAQVAYFLTDRWGLEGWAQPFSLLVDDQGSSGVNSADLGPSLLLGLQDFGAGLVVRYRVDAVSPGTLNLLASAGVHHSSFSDLNLEGSRGADAALADSSGLGWYASAGGEVILGRPFTLGARLRVLSFQNNQADTYTRVSRVAVELVGTLGMAF